MRILSDNSDSMSTLVRQKCPSQIGCSRLRDLCDRKQRWVYLSFGYDKQVKVPHPNRLNRQYE
jgi:hypothetical protein